MADALGYADAFASNLTRKLRIFFKLPLGNTRLEERVQ
jgi:hypothetical protein